jgi:predicted  nucleic acid-binding Zn-ribbon protein
MEQDELEALKKEVEALRSEVKSRREQITDINQWTEMLLSYRHKARPRIIWATIADINNRTTD